MRDCVMIDDILAMKCGIFILLEYSTRVSCCERRCLLCIWPIGPPVSETRPSVNFGIFRRRSWVSLPLSLDLPGAWRLYLPREVYARRL